VERRLTDREELDPDFVIVRSDGQPVFHLVNVVDDLDMGITHVLRGEDHLSNTAKHIALFRAFGVEPPRYAHIPLILNHDGSKMSKRDQGASLTAYLKDGFVPEALLNYLVLLGWSPKEDREIMPLAEIIERFDLPQINRSNARFDADKLAWMNYEYTRNLSPDRFQELAVQALHQAGMDTTSSPLPYVKAALETCRDKIKVFRDVPGFIGFYFQEDLGWDPSTAGEEWKPGAGEVLRRLGESLDSVSPYEADAIQARFKELAKELGVKTGALVHPARWACTAAKVGPSLYHLMAVLGPDRVRRRLAQARDALAGGVPPEPPPKTSS
jgi:glutamyl-tRNA synthetase